MGFPDAKFKLVEEVRDDLRRQLRDKRELARRVQNLILKLEKGACPLCRESKTVIHLRGGLSTCKDCLDILENILSTACKPMTRQKLLAALELQKVLGG